MAAVYIEPVVTDFWQLAKYPGDGYVDPWGPLDCQPHSAARAIERHFEGIKPANIAGHWPPTGAFIRSVTRNADGTLDRSGGTTLAQMRDVLGKYYGMTLEVHYGLPWDDFLSNVEATKGATLSIDYEPIRTSIYRGSFTFSDNHQIFIPAIDRAKGLAKGVIDPLCDGRLTSGGRVSKGPQDMPLSLLKTAAGRLNLATKESPRRLGFGLCYVGFTRMTGTPPVVPVNWTWHIAEAGRVRIYTIGAGGCIQSWRDETWEGHDSQAPGTKPVYRRTCNGASSATTTTITDGVYRGKVVAAFGEGANTVQG